MILGRGEGTFLRKVPSPLPNLSSLPPKTFGWWGGGVEGVRSGGGWGFLYFWGKGCMPWREDGHGPVFRKKKNASVSV